MTPDSIRLAEEAAREWPRLFGFALQLSHDRQEAEDLCQEACLRVLRSDRRIDPDRPLLPLLMTVVRNLHRSRLRSPDPPESGWDLDVEDAASPPPHRAAEMGERFALVEQALRRMNPTWRAALYLADGLSLSYAEIADILDKTEDVVRVTLHRARARVRVLLRSRLAEGAES